jgi:hypothetical protein
MDINRIVKGVIWGVSTAVGLAIAEGIYRSSVNVIDRREKLIGDCEIISDEIELIETPFDLEEEA